MRVLGQNLQPRGGRGSVVGGYLAGYAEWAAQLQSHLLRFCQRVAQVIPQSAEALPRRRVRRPQPGPGRDEEQLRFEVEKSPHLGAHVCFNLAPGRLALEHVILVDHHDDLLAPLADALQEGPFALGEGPVG